MSDETDTEEESGAASQSVGSMPDADEMDTDTIEQERSERLDPENRPDNAEVDNSERTFDDKAGMFTDNELYDEAPGDYVGEEDLADDSEASADEPEDSEAADDE